MRLPAAPLSLPAQSGSAHAGTAKPTPASPPGLAAESGASTDATPGAEGGGGLDTPVTGQRPQPSRKRAAKEEAFVQPPDNFAMMHAGVFRGSFPSKRSLPFMRGLNLRSILYLCPEEPPEYYVQFMREHDIAFLHHGLTGNKEPFVEMSDTLVADAVAELVLARHQPLYVHCDKGKHRTGCVIGCYRRMQVRAPSKRA